MSTKKNSFKIFSIFCILTLTACSSHVAEISGTSQFSSIQADKTKHTYHNVKSGDTLWSISQKYYNNPYYWPNIFKNNADRIYDADLILPGQSIIIYSNISPKSKRKAEIHARTRGLWVVGYREELDIKFLEINQ
jgi:nucleoid-associated protein YgaU